MNILELAELSGMNKTEATKDYNAPSGQLKTRIDYVDLAKGFCIILVVFHHFCHSELGATNPVIMFLRTFRMPLYFILSGLFFKEYAGLWDFIKRKTNKLLIPFCFFLLPSLIMFFVSKRSVNIINFLYQEVWLEDIKINEPIWFLWCLFVNNVLFYVIIILSKAINKQPIRIALICLFSLIIGMGGVFLGKHQINLPLWVDTALTTTPFFAFGYMLRKYTNFLQSKKLDKYLLLCAIACFVYVYCFEGMPFFSTNNMISCSVFSLYSCGILGTMGVLFLAKFFNKLPILSYYGRYSIIILCTHMLLYLVLHRLGVHNSWILLSLVLLSFIIVIPFMRRWFPHVTAQKDVIKV